MSRDGSLPQVTSGLTDNVRSKDLCDNKITVQTNHITNITSCQSTMIADVNVALKCFSVV